MSDTVHDLERDPEDALDRVIRPALRWEAPPHLSANLLALIPTSPALLAAVAPEFALGPRPQPKRWYVVLVTILTLVAIAVSLLVAWDIYGLLSSELGLPDLWQTIHDWFTSGLNQLFVALPQVTLMIDLLAGVRNYLYWLLLVAVLWAALDGWSPNVPFRRQQPS